MKTLLIMTVGQTDVQLVKDNQKQEFAKDNVGELHDYLREHTQEWSLIDSPTEKGGAIQHFPAEPIYLCTPKFDAVLAWFKEHLPERILLLETKRTSEKGDPRFAGEVLKRRAEEKGVQEITLSAYLDAADGRIEDRDKPIDAIIRLSVVKKIERAIANSMGGVTRVTVAASGGMPEVKSLVRELARLYTPTNVQFESIEANDAARDKQPDVAILRHRIDPVEVVRARWHALSLIEKGNLLGAWGAVSHLKDEPGQGWTQVIEWLSQFASSLPFKPPLPSDSDLAVLNHQRMAVRAALRVELALRAGDIPRAVHGTVAFFEAALWDWLKQHVKSTNKSGWSTLVPVPAQALCKQQHLSWSDNEKRPFTEGYNSQFMIDNKIKAMVENARSYLQKLSLAAYGDVIVQEDIRNLRNDVAHNEPTLTLMNEARTRMQVAQLWSNTDTFLSQPLVQSVLKELGEPHPAQLCEDLLSMVRKRLRTID